MVLLLFMKLLKVAYKPLHLYIEIQYDVLCDLALYHTVVLRLCASK